jgi:hypothetical protein
MERLGLAEEDRLPVGVQRDPPRLGLWGRAALPARQAPAGLSLRVVLVAREREPELDGGADRRRAAVLDAGLPGVVQQQHGDPLLLRHARHGPERGLNGP